MEQFNSLESVLRFRTYERGDERLLSALFNSEYAPYCGLMVRSPQYWTWNCLKRPGMHPEGIIIAEESGAVVGYVAADEAGTVWEFAVGAASDREQVATELLSRTVDYLMTLGAARIMLSVPAVDHLLVSACERLGFLDLGKPGLRMHFAVFEFAEVLRKLCDARPPSDDQDMVIELRVRKVGSRGVQSYRMRASDGTPAKGTAPPAMTLTLDQEDLTSIILGTVRPLGRLLFCRIRVRPIGKILVAWRFLTRLHIDAPWFIPLGDVL